MNTTQTIKTSSRVEVIGGRRNDFFTSSNDISNQILRNSDVTLHLTTGSKGLSSYFEGKLDYSAFDSIISDIEQAKESESPYDKVEDKIYSYLSLDKGWDFDEGLVPSYDMVINAISFLKKIKEFRIIPPKPMLASDGEICLFWKKQNLYIEIGFSETSFSYLVDDKKNPYGMDDCSIEKLSSTDLFSVLVDISFS
jgi:hypothetical protein